MIIPTYLTGIGIEPPAGIGIATYLQTSHPNKSIR